jgi:ribosomal protein S18 acetylase RimI-like enzyme
MGEGEHSGLVFRDWRLPGDDALIVSLHRQGYAPHGARFGEAFCDFVAETVAEAGLDDPARGRVWFAERGGRALGCAAMISRPDPDGGPGRGQLRWVVLNPEARGQGIGKRLVALALAHAHAQGHAGVFLETTDGLAESMALYERLGFRTVIHRPEPLWHGEGTLIVMELLLP